MENQVQAMNSVAPAREIGVITSEIKDICRQARSMALMYAVEIGRRLVEAKEVLPHGEWGNWLKNEVEFSKSSAINFMRLFEEYGSQQLSIFSSCSNYQLVGNLPYSKALALLAIPADEREEFAQEVKADEISRSELEDLIKERNAAREREQEFEQKLASAEIAKASAESKAKEADELRAKAEQLEADLKKRKETESKLKKKLKEAQENPQLSEEMLAKLNEDAEAKVRVGQEEEIRQRIENARADAVADIEALQKELAEAKAAADFAEQTRLKAEEAASKAMDELKDAQKKLKLANPKVTLFKKLFEDLQETYNKLNVVYADIAQECPEIAKGLSGAIKSFGDLISQNNDFQQ